ncbi:hypothetical protein EJ02DRAFT_457182 [Clathrospora elynae]|uniref:Uncharacterized protein n=1 Tax=Clathrospora elynae TaxID=706981 RepID=A0A6A5SHI0_9PLEO|nr:hypothetical protein EJ02DRAFT_457182 [Clathrospora elynae]
MGVTFFLIPLLLCLCAYSIDAFPLSTCLVPQCAPLHLRSSTHYNLLSPGWSNEAILTLVGVCVAVVGIFTGLVTSSSKLREWLYVPFRYCLKLVRHARLRRQDDARRRLQEGYSEYLKFNEFLELRRSWQ